MTLMTMRSEFHPWFEEMKITSGPEREHISWQCHTNMLYIR